MASSNPSPQPAIGTVPQGPGDRAELYWFGGRLWLCALSLSASGPLSTEWSCVSTVNTRHVLTVYPLPKIACRDGQLGDRD